MTSTIYTDWTHQRHLYLYPPRDFVSPPRCIIVIQHSFGTRKVFN